jgi:asparagine synthase (glutamine-hydrolysing)
MPLSSPDGRVVLVLSGEEYSACGTSESLLDRYRRDRERFFASLNGRFHGVIADRERGETVVFLDRYGMQRLYFHESTEGFYFAAEAKAIAAVRPELKEPDAVALADFASCGCILHDRTIFRGIQAMTASSAWSFVNGGIVTRRRYFDPKEWENIQPLSGERFYERLKESVSLSLPRYFHGTEQVALALTGGLDTRVLMAWAGREEGSMPCYTFGGMLRESQDVVLARRIAAQSHQRYHVLAVGESFLRQFSSFAARSMYLTEGGTDLSRASDLYLSEHARRIAPAKMVGTYGSEILRRAVMFKPVQARTDVYHRDFAALFNDTAERYRGLRELHPTTFAAFVQSPWYHSGVLALEQSQLTVRAPFLDDDFVKAVYQGSPAEQGDVRKRLVSDRSPELASIRTDRGVRLGRSGMLAAIQRATLEFSFKAEYAYDYGMPDWLVKVDNLMAPIRPERFFLGRHKLLHFRLWYRNQLAHYVKDVLLDPGTLRRPFLNGRQVETAIRQHLDGQRNFTTEIHRLLSLELLYRQFFDRV